MIDFDAIWHRALFDFATGRSDDLAPKVGHNLAVTKANAVHVLSVDDSTNNVRVPNRQKVRYLMRLLDEDKDMRRTYTIEVKVDCHDEEKYIALEQTFMEVLQELKAHVGILKDTNIASVRLRVVDPVSGTREVGPDGD